ncbi:MAG: alpha/beta hydrolase [Candidatus Lambdaproteobacteria bacterium]|nr:alpha/beta hydrolase [Candidatus Lambdaproteobacteria bacterium]
MILPGLNLAPAALTGWVEFLRARGHGAEPLLPSGLRGADDPLWPYVTLERWLADLDAGVAALERRHAARPLSLLGYSMGAVLGLLWASERRRTWRHALLLSPAFGLKPPLRALLALATRALPRRWVLPSVGPAPYCLHRGTTIAAYAALRELVVRFERSGAFALPPAEALFVVHDVADELVPTGLVRRFGSQMPARIDVLLLEGAGAAPAHLRVDEATFGAARWPGLLGRVDTWLAASPVAAPPAATHPAAEGAVS